MAHYPLDHKARASSPQPAAARPRRPSGLRGQLIRMAEIQVLTAMALREQLIAPLEPPTAPPPTKLGPPDDVPPAAAATPSAPVASKEPVVPKAEESSDASDYSSSGA